MTDREVLGKPGVFGNIGWTLEVDSVSVRVRKCSDPHAVAHLRLGCIDSARVKVGIDGKSVLAHEPKRNAVADFTLGRPGVVSLFGELLEHERCASQFQPAPSNLPID